MEKNIPIMNEEKKSSKIPKEKTKFIFTIVGNIIFYLIIIILLLWSIMNINAGSRNGGFPNLFGKGFLSVQSDSMKTSGGLPEEYNDYEIKSFEKGDLLNVNVFDVNKVNDLKVGDVITFYDNNLKALNSHRIVYVNRDSNNNIITICLQGDLSVSLKGVYDPSDDKNINHNYQIEQSGDIATFTSSNFSDIKGVVTSVTYGAGKVLDNLHQNWLWYFVLPVGLLLIFELFMVIKNFMELKGTKQKAALAGDKEAMLAEIQAEKEKMRQELLAELKAQQAAEANKEESKEDTSTTDETK